ncbi:hypothetical protein [Haliovirga abyssi]|uniref:Type II secretion system protein K n=1 Tax=Haliovirga abyssi TaxID=2996794 RepID=A0AAU9D1C7_9FUSO|nr:hypothetical protein [Haliovirga abyssi]BDU49774.1 hypothetical protein HLVA_03430 [Haliovirga abyssi]
MKRNRGYILILILWIIVISNIIFLSMYNSILLENKISLNYMNKKENNQIFLSGLNYAIAILKSDDNNFDSLNEKWAKKKRLNYSEYSYDVSISDLSKININYTNVNILKNLKFWKKESSKKLKDNRFLKNSYEISMLFPKNFNFFTIYGEFNINFDSLESLKLLLKKLKLNEMDIKYAITLISKNRSNSNIKDLKELRKILKPLHLSDSFYEKFEKFITFSGNFNINTISKENFELLFKSNALLPLSSYKNKIWDFKLNNSIEKIKDFDNKFIVPIKYINLLESVFSVRTKYYLVKINYNNNIATAVLRKKKIKDKEYEISILNYYQEK